MYKKCLISERRYQFSANYHVTISPLHIPQYSSGHQGRASYVIRTLLTSNIITSPVIFGYTVVIANLINAEKIAASLVY